MEEHDCLKKGVKLIENNHPNIRLKHPIIMCKYCGTEYHGEEYKDDQLQRDKHECNEETLIWVDENQDGMICKICGATYKAVKEVEE